MDDNVIAVLSMIAILVNTAFITFWWRRMRSEPNRLLVWGVIVNPGFCILLVAVGWLVGAYVRSSISEIVSWVLMGAGGLAIPIGMVLMLMARFKHPAQH
jgi:hypothetical protein